MREQCAGAWRRACPVRGAASTVPLTEDEKRFAVEAGIPAKAFTEEGHRQGAAYAARSHAADERDLARWLTTNDVAARLALSSRQVRGMAKATKLSVAHRDNGRLAFATWQFTDDGQLLPHIPEVLAAFPRYYHPLDIQTVMFNPAGELNGRSPRQLLTEGRALGILVDWLDWLGVS